MATRVTASGPIFGGFLLLVGLASQGCAPSESTLMTTAVVPPAIADPEPNDPVNLGRWQPTITSPRPPHDVVEPDLVRQCGAPDEALQAVALLLATGGTDGGISRDMPRLEFELQVAGAPYVWPHLWTIAGTKLPGDEVARRFGRWLETFADGGVRRCGLARLRGDSGRDVIVAVVVNAIVNLAPLPSNSSVGRWIELEAHLLAPASNASVVLLGPRGRPRTVISSLSGDTIKSSFAPSEPGRWLVQVVATTDTGPRPVARAVLHVNEAPPQEYVSHPVPGEESALANAPPDHSLARMVNAARASEGLPRLPRIS